MHKVRNVSIFMQILMAINWKQLRTYLVQKQIYTRHGTSNYQ